MIRNLLWLAGWLMMAALPAWAADSPKPSAPTTAWTNAPGEQVIAYYFHGTVRCETCQKIEQQAKAEIERQFKPELDAQRLVFKPVNYDLPENAHFLLDYQLPCPSLVLVRQAQGKDVKWKMLGQTWTLVETEAAFDQYVKKEIDGYLREPNNRAEGAGAPNTPANELISELTPGTKVDTLAELNVRLGDLNAAFVFVHATNGASLIN